MVAVKNAVSGARVASGKIPKPLKVLILGNNPISLGEVFEVLDGREFAGQKFSVDVCFDAYDCLRKLRNGTAFDCVIIDDTLGISEMRKLFSGMKEGKATQNFPVSMIKSDNHHSVPFSGIFDFILREDMNLARLNNTITRSINFSRRSDFQT
ncbi:hypothetical protein FUAX_37880 [Fulvitalea axinellae]|uniref:Response regulatory domain-containing protein n=1 Tax=Fulvitalea axinellae TaxID=1182444 RepID=A0AAU9CQB7_9BACT|nr:hypothetical protein FUAX_37880 [Fulvitalea axinellae]